ncbi:uncharacterized protein LY89DRAFT_767351 [Mollisia scopiformis]|uniref:Uncharacterized protein n=1 Tax=Mollisia scopiformis TaxID=149040 RepID=A0A132B4V3_MOLSC|nr:uncharacterized protein LY89DRAFT_767351 [Mollisia scopiformis]KUJ07019.1 hypothetical protein LY89DRAFT_767351 [Mollisia scopiformis]
MSAPRNETTTLNYAKWLPIYEKEVPYQIISAFAGNYKKTNLELGPAPCPEVIHDMCGMESNFTADSHGFQVCHQETTIQNWTNREVVESQYFAEMESLLKKEPDDVDEVFFYDWRRPRKNIPFKTEGIVEVDLEVNSQYLLPVGNAHVDLSAAGVFKRVRSHMGDRAESLLQGRVRAMNVWTPTCSWPVRDRPLALCDGTFVKDTNLLPTDHIKKGYIEQTSNLMYRSGFRWYYLSGQRKDECLIFKM